MTLRTTLLRPVTVGVLTIAGCQQPSEIRYETEHLRIGTDFDEPLCQGNLDHLERVVTTASTSLSTQIVKPVEVYVWDIWQWQEETQKWCSEEANGCFRDGVVYASEASLDHELIHAVVETIADPPSFWDEGAAEALQSHRTIFGHSDPTVTLEREGTEVDYLTAGHFSRWLLETYGDELYGKLLRAGGSAREAFESTYEMSIEQAQAQYLEAAPYSYGARVGCEAPELPQSDDVLGWAETIEVDCSHSDVYGGSSGMAVRRVLTIPEQGDYTITTTSQYADITRCPIEDIEIEPLDGDPALGDVPPLNDVFLFQYIRSFAGDGEPTTLNLAAGRYEVSFAHDDHTPRTVHVEVRRAE
jgi:hypothetical protein